MIHRTHLRSLIVSTLQDINLYSRSAVNLLLGTAAQESRLGTYLCQIDRGPALGIFQMEPNTEQDIWYNFLKFNPELSIITISISHVDGPSLRHLEGNLIYQIIMARVHYLRISAPLPTYNDINALAKYWKDHYNTAAGKGTEKEFIQNYQKLISGF